MTRSYRHAVTGREIVVVEGTRMAQLVADDENWSEVTSGDAAPEAPRKKAPRKK